MKFIWGKLFFCMVIFASCTKEKDERDPIPNSGSDQSNHAILPNLLETEGGGTSNQTILNRLLEAFDKPLRSYPLIASTMIQYKNGGIAYREQLDEPFTGRVEDRSEDGVTILQSSYLDGIPHGKHIRRFSDGVLAMETIYNRGVLIGVKKKWWENGTLKEEEYWNEGNYSGKTLWDRDGRIIRQEWAR